MRLELKLNLQITDYYIGLNTLFNYYNPLDFISVVMISLKVIILNVYELLTNIKVKNSVFFIYEVYTLSKWFLK